MLLRLIWLQVSLSRRLFSPPAAPHPSAQVYSIVKDWVMVVTSIEIELEEAKKVPRVLGYDDVHDDPGQ